MYKDKLNWNILSQYQKLRESFIMENNTISKIK